jgi:hypothetical protein
MDIFQRDDLPLPEFRVPSACGRHLASGTRVARELDRLVMERGKPKMVVSDNGSQLTSIAILARADQSRVAWHYIAPGKPMQNAFTRGGSWRCENAAVTIAEPHVALIVVNFAKCGRSRR